MLQTLFHIPREVFGLPLFGFGVLLVLWLIGSAILLLVRVRRHGWDAETRGYLPIILIFAAAIAFVAPAIIAPEGLPIRGYGTMLVVAIVSSVALGVYRAQRVGIHPEMILSMAFWAFLGGILGARIFYVVEYWREFDQASLTQRLFAIANLTQGGLVVYGALIGGALAVILFVIKYRLPPLAIGDLVAPSVALGLGLGRIGCFLNGCCFGGPSDLPWAVRFPAPSPPYQRQVERGELFVHGIKLPTQPDLPAEILEVEPESPAALQGLRAGDRLLRINDMRVTSGAQALGLLISIAPGEQLVLEVADKPDVAWTLPAVAERGRPIHPTQLYSAVDGVVLCFFLLAIYPFRRRDGEVLAWLMTLHPISRFLLEVVRVDEPGVYGTALSIGQVVSLILLAGAVIMWAYLLIRPKGTVLPPVASAAASF